MTQTSKFYCYASQLLCNKMTFAQRDVSFQLLLHADWPTHSWSRSRYHGNNVELTKVPECYPLDVFIWQYSLFCYWYF